MEKYPIILISKKIKTKRNTYWTNSKVHSYLKDVMESLKDKIIEINFTR